jgi:hypothetical protein
MGREGALCVCQSCAIGNSCLDFCRCMRDDGSRRECVCLPTAGNGIDVLAVDSSTSEHVLFGGCWTELMRASLARALIGDA